MPVEVTAMKNTPSKRGSLLTAAWYRRSSSVLSRGDTLPPGAPPSRGIPPDPHGPDPDGPRPPRSGAATPVMLSVMPPQCQLARTRTGGNRTSTPGDHTLG